MSRHNFLSATVFIFLLNACSSDVFLVHNGNMPAEDKVAALKNGQTYNEVESILGAPSCVSTLDPNTWLYISSSVKKVAFFKPEIVERDILSVTFDKQGKVQKISKLNQQDGKEIQIDNDQTQSGGHNPGFFKKYFGGVGSYLPLPVSKK